MPTDRPRPQPRPRRRAGALVGAVVAVLSLATAAACGDDGGAAESGEAPSSTATGGGTGGGSGAFPVSLSTVAGTVTIEAPPERIVSLAPSLTEMLFAIGAGDQVVAVDDQSNYPDDAPLTDLSGFTPNVEAIIGYEPDLVVLSDDIGDVVAGLGAADVPVLQLPAAATLDETYAQIEQLGVATGNIADAAAVVGGMQADIDELVAQVPARDTPLTYYHELDETLFTVTSSTFIGEIYALAGLENIADAADADGSAGGYPQLSVEALVAADPDLVFLADTKCCGQDAATVAARPGFDALTAVREGRVVELDDDIASRWGPRVVDLLAAVVAATAAVPVG